MRERFNRDFWLDDQDHYVLAYQAENKPVTVMSSNPGHALWAGIADGKKARRTAERLVAPDMFNGWGIRTLSEEERGYNPIGYHLGTVWPHDNALIAAGFRRYGFDDAFIQVFTGILEAATFFEHHRLPELFTGFAREQYDVPVRYPLACHPQAWAAGAVPYFLATALGLQPEAFEKKLRVVRPVLPPFLEHVKIHKLQVGDASVDLAFDRAADGNVAVQVTGVEGEVEVVVELAA